MPIRGSDGPRRNAPVETVEVGILSAGSSAAVLLNASQIVASYTNGNVEMGKWHDHIV